MLGSEVQTFCFDAVDNILLGEFAKITLEEI